MAVGGAELVADMRGDTGLDAAGPQRDEHQPRHQPHGGLTADSHQREGEVTEAIDDGKRNDGLVLPEEGVGDDCTKERREVDRRGEQVDLLRGGGVAHRLSGRIVHEPEILGHEDRQDRLHAVEAEAFRGFVAHDERNARGHSFDIRIR